MNRASATFCMSGPNTGIRNFSGSTTSRTLGEYLFFRYQIVATDEMPRNGMKNIGFLMISDAVTSIWVGSGRSPPNASKSPENTGTTKISMPVTIEHRDHADGDRVGQGRLDLAAEPDVRLERVRDLDHRRVEEAADLAGAHHAHHDRRELLVLAEGVGERVALLHLVAHVDEQIAQAPALGLLGQDRQAAQDRQAGREHRGELAGEDRKVLGLHLALADPDLHVEAGAQGLDGDRGQPLLARAGERLGLAGRLHPRLDQPPGLAPGP